MYKPEKSVLTADWGYVRIMNNASKLNGKATLYTVPDVQKSCSPEIVGFSAL